MRIAQVGLFHQDLGGAFTRTLARGWPDVVRAAPARAISAYLRSAYGRCQVVVGASDAAVAAMRAAGLPNPRLVPFGVDLDTFRPEARDPAWKREVGAEGRPVALYVGRLTREKNLPVLLDALPRMHRDLDLKLVMIGDGGWRGELERLADRSPAMLTVLPYETDRVRLARAYASADLYVAPSPHETFGLAALEAAACGLPIVGASAGALAERLTDAPWARTFAPDSPRALAEAVESALPSSTGALQNEARKAACGFGWDRTFTTMLGIYTEVAVSR